MDRDRDSDGSLAESLFAEFLRRRETGEAGAPLEFAAWVAEHEEQRAELEAYHADWRNGPTQSAVVAGTGNGDSQPFAVLDRLRCRTQASERYRVDEEIARGGQGAVMKVWDEDLQRNLAMKVVLPPGVDPGDETAVDVDSRTLGRFLEEAQVTGQLDHPGIVPIHELGIDADGRTYFTMKLVKGRTLKDVLDEYARGEGDWNETRILNLILKACEAMSYAHAKGVIHRDLKPSNIMIGRFGEVYVMDWGLARVLGKPDRKDIRIQAELQTEDVRSDRRTTAASSPDSPLITMDGDVVGTPAYMSPQQARGEVEELAPATDVYSMGAILYQAITGRAPYVTPDAPLNNYAIWSRVQEGPPKSISSIAPKSSLDLTWVCEKAMSRDVARRYETVDELRRDLGAYNEQLRVPGYRPTVMRRVAGQWARSSPFSKIGFILAYTLLVIGGGAIWLELQEELAEPRFVFGLAIAAPGLLAVAFALCAAGFASRNRARGFALAGGLPFLICVIPLVLLGIDSLSAFYPAVDVLVAYGQGDWERTVELLEPRENLEVDERVWLAQAMWNLGRTEEAIDRLDADLSISPMREYIRAPQLHALLLLDSGAVDEARLVLVEPFELVHEALSEIDHGDPDAAREVLASFFGKRPWARSGD